MEQKIESEDFLERFGSDIYKTLIKRWVLITLIIFRLGFLDTDLCKYFRLYMLVFVLKWLIQEWKTTKNNCKFVSNLFAKQMRHTLSCILYFCMLFSDITFLYTFNLFFFYNFMLLSSCSALLGGNPN